MLSFSLSGERTCTENKPLESPTWNLDEGEEMCKDIYDLQKNAVTKDEL